MTEQSSNLEIAAKWPVSLRLLLISFLSLYFELLLIRWLPTEIRILAYFNNVILISCILGLGIGALLSNSARRLDSNFYLLLGSLILLADLYHGIDIQLPLTTESYFIWNGLSRAAKGNILQYLAMFVFFSLNIAVFVPLGQMLGREFDRLPAIRAYSINVFGALLGMSAFALFSKFGVNPVWWFTAGTVLLLPMMRLSAVVIVSSLLVIALGVVGSLERSTYWSPYYKITLETLTIGSRGIGHQVNVNEDSHQQALDLSGIYDRVGDMKTRRMIYDVPYQFGDNSEVLIVGAGTGNDVAAALRAGAQKVEAVEIDPLILNMGREIHPEKPYENPRVVLVNKDARTYLRNSRQNYDKIVLGYLDSHSLFSAMSSVRLDNFVYTREFFQEMKSHLKPNGMIALTFTVHEKWIADRLFTLFVETFGYPPLVFQGAKSSSSGTVFLAGEPIHNFTPQYVDYDPVLNRSKKGHTWVYVENVEGFLAPEHFSTSTIVPVDNWPYLYLQDNTIPLNYLVCMACLIIFSLFLTKVTTGLGKVNLHFFFLGSAFLLVETKAITELAIFLGSTWIVNFFVISTILGLILLANLIVSSRWCPPTKLIYLALFATLLITYFVPLAPLLAWDSPLRNWVAVLILCLPLFFAGLIFGRQISIAPSPSAALGSNLLGALVGGFLEYSSMIFGLKVLYLFGILLYLLSFVFMKRSQS